MKIFSHGAPGSLTLRKLRLEPPRSKNILSGNPSRRIADDIKTGHRVECMWPELNLTESDSITNYFSETKDLFFAIVKAVVRFAIYLFVEFILPYIKNNPGNQKYGNEKNANNLTTKSIITVFYPWTRYERVLAHEQITR